MLIALDRASVRAKDADGRLHVGLNPISKANICEYFGAEIPNYAALGLDPAKRYKLWRHPDELAKAVATFNRLPVLRKHIPVSAEAPATDLIIGTTGSDADFDGQYLNNTLAFWDQSAIDDIENDEARQLSSAYRYTADMTPGVTEGLQYDGIMRDIVGNHVALVPEGRAGPDVIVGDSKPETRAVLMTKTALRMHGALSALLHPMIAQDASPKVAPLLVGVTAQNFKTKRKAVLAGVAALAQDANIDEVGDVLDKIAELGKEVLEEEVSEVEEVQASDADHTKLLAFLEGKLAPEDMATLQEMLGGAAGAEDEDEDEPEMKPDPKAAMDAAINAAVARVNALHAAREDVKPLVGNVSMALDSAEAVYATALKAKGVDIKGVDPSAYKALVNMQIAMIATPAKPQTTIAQDAAALTGLESALGFKLPAKSRSY